ncbi:MAG TPA: molybdenum cofactor biosynthesis protein MoaE [Methanolinea sp.]|jgi:molybdopterin synthase catalytic subunit|nr:molybdenum cofactor biosynthesis protein MoaE [Methanolinea sp.]MDI6900066.1 molybdenum cofactor biosynthesis protein MoaE [Methanolinea sp.]HOS81565.1 molybdenum cofactor biosynthesis protein MoaE [Methanolinea sp.]HPC54849.1 molybdenum cofactor biosynthesis protein MoaE [Methanolinea sp.]HQE85416.1 molybdenum cofactor biosynthesis protein MoaE [Methanolinea sp.]
MIKVTRDDFDPGEIIEGARQRNVGAVVSFLGIVRDDGIERMDVEAFEEVAEQDLQAIAREAEAKFGVVHVDIIHRVGHLSVGDSIVLIVVGASHRKAGFLACEYIIDRIKEHVPVWKKEYTREGARWVEGGH